MKLKFNFTIIFTYIEIPFIKIAIMQELENMWGIRKYVVRLKVTS